ncbi:hypothetical protein [Sphingomonas mollis]|nr:hypothetical protein [Sphingomonas sp. BT553]
MPRQRTGRLAAFIVLIAAGAAVVGAHSAQMPALPDTNAPIETVR